MKTGNFYKRDLQVSAAIIKYIGRQLIYIAGYTMVRPIAWIWTRKGYFKKTVPDKKPAKVAIIACHWLGDTFWASQVMPYLKKKWPETQATVFTKAHSLDLWHTLLPNKQVKVAGVITSDRRREAVSWYKIIKYARRHRPENFDIVIDLTGNRYSAIFAFLLRPCWAIGFNGQELGWLYSYNVKDAEAQNRHLSERPFRVVEPILEDFAYPQSLEPPPRSKKYLDLQIKISRPLVVIAPGAGWSQKRWPLNNFIQTAKILQEKGHQIALIGSAKEKTLCRQIASHMPQECIIMTGYRISEVCALLAQAKGFIGNDSGPGHLAAALGIPTGIIFTGASDPQLCAPKGPCVKILTLVRPKFQGMIFWRNSWVFRRGLYEIFIDF